MTMNQSSPFDPREITRAFAPLGEDATPRVHEVFTGNINTILKVEMAGGLYGLRVRTQETVYRYEPNLIKEVFALRLLARTEEQRDDQAVAAAFAEIHAALCGSNVSRHEILPMVRYFDWSRERLPHPYCIYDWVEGAPLWESPDPRLYASAGAALAQIHQVRFSAFYADFLSVGVTPVSWAERFRAALAKELSAALPRLPQPVAVALKAIEIPPTVSCTPCLVHNDFAPGNILVRNGQVVAVIDWDNAVIEAPHLDFVKMKYWTAKNTAGELAHDAALFAAFVDGYGPDGQELIRSSLFSLYEILWLLRVFNFERSKAEQGFSRAPGYPAAEVYDALLRERLTQQKQ
jgi:aminoglycoside phosphotransferase (APT) family kinase protein